MGNGPHPLCPRGPRAYFDGPYGGLCSTAARSKNTALRFQNIATHRGTIIRDAVRRVATNAPVPTVDGQRAGKGGHGDARGGDGGWATGGEIFAKTAKTPPLQSGVARMPLRSKCRPIAAFTMPIPSAPLTASHEPRGFYNDAARRVATVFERLNCVIETSLPVRNASYKRLIPSRSFAAVPFGNTAA